MKNYARTYAKAVAVVVVAGIFLASVPSARAATVSEQITTAIADKNYRHVQTLAKSDPNVVGHAENSLLKHAQGNLTKRPQDSANAMAAAAAIAPGITPKDAREVADNVKNIVKDIADKALFLCNPESNANTAQVRTPEEKKKIEDAKAIASVLESSENIAKTPAVVAVAPRLFADIAAQRQACIEDPLLAQSANFQRPSRPVRPIPPEPPPPPPPASPN
jgi:hypothetical protein